MYYLPEFTTIQLVPDPFFVDTGPERPYLTARDRELFFSGPSGFDLRSLVAPPATLRHVVHVVSHDVEASVKPSCVPYLRPLRVTDAETFAVLPLTDEVSVHVTLTRLDCRVR